jgi:hypothetical protein
MAWTDSMAPLQNISAMSPEQVSAEVDQIRRQLQVEADMAALRELLAEIFTIKKMRVFRSTILLTF